MKHVSSFTLCAASLLVAGCVDVDDTDTSMPIGVTGQEQACAGRFSELVGTPMSNVRTNGRDTSPAGNTVVFLQTADLSRSATCEIDDFGTIVDMNLM